MNANAISTVHSSESIGKLTTALQAFQKKCPKIPKSSKNPFLNSRYADLATILDIIKEPLLEAELSVMQMPTGEYGLTTVLSHTSGEWISSNYIMQPLESVIDKQTKEKAITPQSMGSVITYQRRYAIGAILCLNIDDDNDANPTHGQVDNSAPATPPKKTAQQLLEEAKAAAAAPTAPVVTATAPATETAPKQLLDAPDGPTEASVHGPSTDAQVSNIKLLLSTWEQTTPGVSAQFVQTLHASGRKKISELSYAECALLEKAITARQLSDFFGQSLQQPLPV
jgi:hypothetical protein